MSSTRATSMAFNAGCVVVQVAASAQRDPKKRKDLLGYSAQTRTMLPAQVSQQSFAISEEVWLIGILVAEKADVKHVAVVVR